MFAPRSTASRRRPLGVLLGAAMLLLTACSSGPASAPEGPGAPPGAAPAQGTFPVTVAHKYGSTEIKAQPKRVVTLGLSDHDAVLALGVRPVGVIDWFKERPFGKWPWTQPLWADFQPEIVGERDEYNLEKISALAPDLIIAQYSGMAKEQYDKLSQIAPTVGQPLGFADYAAPWQEMTRAVGKSLGQAEKVEELIFAIDKKFADAKAAHPEFAGKTAIVADTFEPGKYAIFAPHDPKMQFLVQLGYDLPQSVVTLVKPEQNVVNLSSEQAELLEADRLVWLSSDAGAESRIKADLLYQKLRVVQNKQDLFVSYEDPPIGAAMSFSTVLSVPYAVDQLVPLLAAPR